MYLSYDRHTSIQGENYFTDHANLGILEVLRKILIEHKFFQPFCPRLYTNTMLI